MANKNTSFQTPGQGADRSGSSGLYRNFHKGDSCGATREALYKAFFEISTKNRKRNKRIEKLSYLVAELRRVQPVDIGELAANLGQAESTIRKDFKKLIKLDLVVQTRFEHHTLYCINGDFNGLIENICAAIE